MKVKLILALIYLLVILLAAPLWAVEPSNKTPPKESEAGEKSLTELNKELTNPISSLWSIAFQQNN